MPDVSVIIPAYEASSTIERCLAGILSQDFSGAYEVVVVDDGSTDQTPQIVTDLARSSDRPVRLVSQANAGAGHARNRGVAEARADIVAFCDADDLWRPEMLSSCMPLMMRHNPPGVLTGFAVRRADDDHERIEVLSPEDLAPVATGLGADAYLLSPEAICLYLKGRYIGNDDALVIRRQVLQDIGGFPEDYPVGEDFLLWLRMLSKLSMVYVARPLATIFINPQSRSRADMETTWENIVKVLEQFRQEEHLSPRIRRIARQRTAGCRMSLAISRWRKRSPWFGQALRSCCEHLSVRQLRDLCSMLVTRPKEN